MTLHSEISLGQIHVPYNWTYADASARAAASGFTVDDVGKMALQSDNHSLWILTDDSPVTWFQLTGSGVGGAVTSVNGSTGAVTLDADDIDDSSTSNKFSTAAEITKLAGIQSGATANSSDA